MHHQMGLAVESRESHDAEWDVNDLCLIEDEELLEQRHGYPVFSLSTNRILFVDQQRRDQLVRDGIRTIKLLDRLE
ncbi:MAG: hypothetical protein WEA31_03590 [Pirellulales bacterium]